MNQSFSLKTYLEIEENIKIFGYAMSKKEEDEFSKRLEKGWYSYYKNRTYQDMASIPDYIIFLDTGLVPGFFEKTGLLSTDYINIQKENPLFACLKRNTL